jgi:DNA-binding NarL/FixJ family response regulator
VRIIIDHPGPTEEVRLKAQAASRATKRRRKQENVAKARELHAMGWQRYRIAQKLQVSSETVRVYLRECQTTTKPGSGNE